MKRCEDCGHSSGHAYYCGENVRRLALEEAATLLETEARQYWQPDHSSVIDALNRLARKIRELP